MPLEPSRLALGVRAGFGLGFGALLLYRWGLPWSLMALPPLLMAVWLYRFCPPPELRCVDGEQWEARQPDDGSGAWQPVTLSVQRLGVGIIELAINGRVHALWPDSTDAETRRRLRRLLLRQSGHHAPTPTPWWRRLMQQWQRRHNA